MKPIITIYFLLTTLCLGLCSGCTPKQDVNPGRTYFTLNPNDRKILLPVVLNDSITANLVFDTGGALVLDSTFSATYPNLTANLFNIYTSSSSSPTGWVRSNIHRSIYEGVPNLKIGDVNMTSIDNSTQIWNLKKFNGNPDVDGIFNISNNDTTNIWEINFEENYMEVHSANEFSMPKDCFVYPFIRPDPHRAFRVSITIPLKIKCANGDTLTLHHSYLIDTAMPWDIVVLRGAKELDFFNNQEGAVWTSSMGSYIRHCNVDGTLHDDFKMDSLRIYTNDHNNRLSSDYMIGINFLKRFNVFFDMKNNQVGLQPIKNFQRVVSPMGIRFHFSYAPTTQNALLVTKVADYEANYYKTAGLREGDEIVAINGKQYEVITHDNYEAFRSQDTLLLDIIRKGRSLEIVVPVNKTEVQGD